MTFKASVLAATAVFWMSGTAYAQPPSAAPTPAPAPGAPGAPAARAESRSGSVGNKTGEIVSQPARDVGINRAKVPPPLLKATEDTYGLTGLKSCRQLASAVKELNEVLGPDFERGGKHPENRMAKLAQAGGRTVVNSIIPFRGLVREVSGAAPSDRRLQAAVEAGYARRGFLRGVHATRNCRPRL